MKPTEAEAEIIRGNEPDCGQLARNGRGSERSRARAVYTGRSVDSVWSSYGVSVSRIMATGHRQAASPEMVRPLYYFGGKHGPGRAERGAGGADV